LGFADVLADLAEIGWSCEWGTYRASDVGAPHRRERIFIIAGNPNNDGASTSARGRSLRVSQKLRGSQESSSNRELEGASDPFIANTKSQGLQGSIVSRLPLDSQRLRQRVAEGDSSSFSAHASCGTGREGQGWDYQESEGPTRLATHIGPSIADTNNARDTHRPKSKKSQHGAIKSTAGGFAADTAVTIGRQSTLQGTQQEQPRGCGGIVWGKYAPAIARWEAVLERAAPAPTVERNDKRRLNPQFVEWMMGLPDGWVTGHGLSAAKELKMLGNGVVPQQAHAAITQLMQRATP